MDFITGECLLIDKPLTWTSFDAVNKIRFLLKRHVGIKKIKVGHAGTLDPLATGLIIVCTGKATKGIQALMDHDKEYVATICIGQTTPSYDRETDVDATYPASHVTRELVEAALENNFLGEAKQVPPTFSAIRVDGHRAYEYARKGRHDEVALPARKVTFLEQEIVGFSPATTENPTAELILRVACSKGTYIRALARDLGEALGSGAHLTALRRTKVGEFSVSDAMTMEQVEDLIRQQPPVELKETN